MKSLIAIAILSLAIFSTQATSIRGQWSSISVANVITSLPFTITDTEIRVNHRKNLVYGYRLDGNRIIVNFISQTNGNSNNNRPSEDDLRNCLNDFYTYEVKGDMVQIKNQNGKLMAQLRKTGDVAADIQHPIVNSPIVTPVPPQVANPVFRDPGILKNKWKVNVVKGTPVIMPVEITSTNIIFQFCNRQSLPFTVSNNNGISIQNKLDSSKTCEHYFPPEADVVKAFSDSTSYDVNEFFLYLKRGNEVYVFLEKMQ